MTRLGVAALRDASLTIRAFAMRFVGRVSDWNDDKGFGFVVPHGGGVRAFVHVKAFQFGSRRPVDGDLISYEASRDARGRTNAINVRFAGQRIEKREPHSPFTQIGAWLDLSDCGHGGRRARYRPGFESLVGYLAVSAVSHAMYWLDKIAAEKGMQRTPESTLHFVDLLGGWPGGLIAQQQFRHKTVKASFQTVFWFTVLANIAVTAWLVHNGSARALTNALLGG